MCKFLLPESHFKGRWEQASQLTACVFYARRVCCARRGRVQESTQQTGDRSADDCDCLEGTVGSAGSLDLRKMPLNHLYKVLTSRR